MSHTLDEDIQFIHSPGYSEFFFSVKLDHLKPMCSVTFAGSPSLSFTSNAMPSTSDHCNKETCKILFCWVLKTIVETSLVVQWLRLHASNAGGMGLIPGWGSKIPQAVWHHQKIKNIVEDNIQYGTYLHLQPQLSRSSLMYPSDISIRYFKRNKLNKFKNNYIIPFLLLTLNQIFISDPPLREQHHLFWSVTQIRIIGVIFLPQPSSQSYKNQSISPPKYLSIFKAHMSVFIQLWPVYTNFSFASSFNSVINALAWASVETGPSFVYSIKFNSPLFAQANLWGLLEK